MTNKDDDLWQLYTKKLSAIKGTRKPSLTKPSSEKSAARRAAVNTDLRRDEKTGLTSPIKDIALERAREKSFRRGDVAIDAKLDMHGLTQVLAFEALAIFMHRAMKNHKRSLLIITGKGSEGNGILRRNFRTWLTELPEHKHILAVRQAAPKHGGEGAFYILLKRSGPLHRGED